MANRSGGAFIVSGVNLSGQLGNPDQTVTKSSAGNLNMGRKENDWSNQATRRPPTMGSVSGSALERDRRGLSEHYQGEMSCSHVDNGMQNRCRA